MDQKIERGIWGVAMAVGAALRLSAVMERAGRATLLDQIDSRIYRQLADALSASPVPAEGFFMSPAYPYWLTVFSPEGPFPPLLILQSLLGLGAVAALALVARRLGGPVAGIGTLALGVFAGPLVLYDTSVLPDGPAFALLAGSLALVTLRPDGTLRRLLLAGLLGALAYGLRSNLLPPLLLTAAWLAWRNRPGGWRPALAFVAPLLVGMLGIAALNQAAYGRFTPRSFNAGQNLYIGNHPGTDGTYTPVNGIHPGDMLGREVAQTARGRPLDAAEVEAYWREQANRFLTADPGATLGLWLRKLVLVLHPYDIPQMESLFLTREESTATRLAWVGFGWVLVLAVTGVLHRPSAGARNGAPLTAVAVAAIAICVVFFVNGRLRHPLWIALLPWAGLGVAAITGWIRNTTPRRGAWTLAVGLALWGGLSLYPAHATFREAMSACRYATLEALGGDRSAAREWMAVQGRLTDRPDLESTFRTHPESRWLLALERAATWFTLGELRRAFDDLAPAAEALPTSQRAQQGLVQVCDRMLQQGLGGPEVRAARQRALRRLQGS